MLADGTPVRLSAKRKGQFVALDAKTGALKWGSEGRNETSVRAFTATHVVYLTAGGAAADQAGAEGFTTDRQYEVAQSAKFAPPLFVDGELLVRDAPASRASKVTEHAYSAAA